VLFKR